MGLTYNDLKTRGYLVRTLDGDAVVSGPCRIFSMGMNSTTNDGILAINDALTKAGGGTTIRMDSDVTLWVGPMSYSFGPNGIRFGTGLSVTISGTGVTAWVAYMVE
jgi:hypothetical protein